MPLSVSDAFKDAVKRTHAPTRRVVVVDTDDESHAMLVRSGTLTWTAGGYPSGQASIEVADLSDHPLPGAAWMKPYGARVKVWAGYVGIDGTAEEVLVADMVITDVEQRQPEQTLMLTAATDEALIASDAFGTPVGRYDVSGDTGAWQNLQAIVQRTLPSVTISLDDTLTDPGLAPDTIWDGDAWACVVDCLEALDAEAYFTPDRVLHVRSAAIVATDPDVTLSQGTRGSTVVGVTSAWVRGVNTVTVRGNDATDGTSTSGSAARTGAQDPSGAMGPVRLVEDYPTDGTTGDLDTAAEGLLRRVSRRNRTVTVDTMPKPWVILGDTARLVWADASEETLLVRSVTLSLVPSDPMTLELAETWGGIT